MSEIFTIIDVMQNERHAVRGSDCEDALGKYCRIRGLENFAEWKRYVASPLVIYDEYGNLRRFYPGASGY